MSEEIADAASPTPVDSNAHVCLIDGSGYIFRAFHALPALTRKSDGLPIGAVAGFCNMLWKMRDAMMSEAATSDTMSGDDRPTHLAVIFDSGSKTFRNDLYHDYKAHRPPPPPELAQQFPLFRDATRAFGLPCVELKNFEADDLIATYAVQASAAGAHVTIVSSDKDLMQLVRQADAQTGAGAVKMRDPMKNREIGCPEVVEKFGVGPERVIDVQALAGDSADNVPGAPGIGVKTAATLIAEFGDLDTLLAQADAVKQPKRRETLIAHADQIRLSRDLVRLATDAPVPQPMETFGLKRVAAEPLMAFLNAMEFRTLTQRVATRLGRGGDATVATAAAAEPPSRPGQTDAAPPIAPDAYEIVRDLPTLERWIARAHALGAVAVDTETTSLDEMTAELIGVSLCVQPGEACYIPLAHRSGVADSLLDEDAPAEGQAPFDQVLAALRPLLADPAVLKVGQNLKYDIKVLARYGLTVTPFDDTMLLSYVVANGLRGHGMDALSEVLLDHKPIPIKELIGAGKNRITFDRVDIATAARYAAEDADVTLRLHRLLRPHLARSGLTSVYETLERPLAPVLADMERTGVLVDRAALAALSTVFSERMAALESEIHTLAGAAFNVGSPKQLGEMLFDRLGVPGGKRSKNGAWSTGADVLEQLAAQGHDLPARVLDWRQLSKLKGTYSDALQTHINADTGRVHTSFSMAATTTGRLASTDPNLQNIPIRTDEGRRIREAFIVPGGKTLLSLDYSQIELRILAHIADIKPLQAAFHDGIDIHAMTASEVFGAPIEGMDPMVRRRAKAINFGVIYGISAFGLANQLRIPVADARRFIDAYFEKFPGIRAYMDRTVADAKKHGYVETLFGRRIHTPAINGKGPHAAFAARAAINAPIQGSAADVIRRAMVRIPPLLTDMRLPARMVLQVHDELVFEVDADAVDEAARAIGRVMERAATPVVALQTPLVVDAGAGENWALAH